MRTLPLVLLFLFPSYTTHAQEIPDAVVVEPHIHKVIIENEYVRVVRAMASAGATAGMHSHPPALLVSLGDARYRLTMPDGTRTIVDVQPGQTFWLDGDAHSWELIAGDSHMVAVEVKHAAGRTPPSTQPLPASDAVARDPTHHLVVFENDHVRVVDARAAPGATSPMHTHPPTVAVNLSAFRARTEAPDREPMITDGLPGEVFWYAAGGQHAWQLLAGSARVIAVEIKSARTPPR